MKFLVFTLTAFIYVLLSSTTFSQDVWDLVGKTKKEVLTSYGSKYELNENGAWTYYFNGPGVTLEFDSRDNVSRAIYIGPYNKLSGCNKGKKEFITKALHSGFKKEKDNCYIRGRLEINISTDKADNLFVLYVAASYSD